MRRHWFIVLGTALPAALLAGWLGLPAAWLVGPLLGSMLLALAAGVRLAMPRRMDLASQAVVGVVISQSFRTTSLGAIAAHWLPVLAVTAGTLALSLGGGALLARLSSLDPATATLGTIPGGAGGMVAMSEALGADPRLVAVMQYLRVILVVLSATLLARFAFPLRTGDTAHIAAGISSAAPPADYVLTLVAATLGAVLALRLHLPAGALVGPMLLSIGLVLAGPFHPALPIGVAQIGYALIGIRVGLLFDAASVRRIIHLVPAVVGFVLALMAGCAVLAWGLTVLTGLDGLTAYLATTPGGLDSMAITALGSGADTPIVIAAQMARFLATILIGPPLVRLLVRRYAAAGDVAGGRDERAARPHLSRS